MDESAKQLVETRRAEAMALFATAHDYNARNDRLVALGVPLIAAAAGLGLKEHHEEVLLAVPMALLLLMTYALQVDTDLRVIGIARRRLEQVLEIQLEAPALIYYSCVTQFRRGRYILGIVGVQAVIIAVTAGTAIAGAVIAEDKGTWVLILYLLLFASLSACFVRALMEQRLAERGAAKALENWAGASST
jgi:hypothetical protein